MRTTFLGRGRQMEENPKCLLFVLEENLSFSTFVVLTSNDTLFLGWLSFT